MQQKISKKIELIIKVLYKEEGEEEKKGIIPFCLISSSLFVASTTINKQINKNISK